MRVLLLSTIPLALITQLEIAVKPSDLLSVEEDGDLLLIFKISHSFVLSEGVSKPLAGLEFTGSPGWPYNSLVD